MFKKELEKLIDYLIQKLKDDSNWKFAWKNTCTDTKLGKVLDKNIQLGELEIRIWMSPCEDGYKIYLLVEDTKDGYSGCIYSPECPKLIELSELLTSKTVVEDSLNAFYNKLNNIYES